MLSTLEVDRGPEAVVFITVPPGRALAVDVQPFAMVEEREGTTFVVRRHEADRDGYAYDFVGAWLTLHVHSSLAAVGLTAAVSRALADAGIPANILAGHYHDHVLVPAIDADRAIAALAALTTR